MAKKRTATHGNITSDGMTLITGSTKKDHSNPHFHKRYFLLNTACTQYMQKNSGEVFLSIRQPTCIKHDVVIHKRVKSNDE